MIDLIISREGFYNVECKLEANIEQRIELTSWLLHLMMHTTLVERYDMKVNTKGRAKCKILIRKLDGWRETLSDIRDSVIQKNKS